MINSILFAQLGNKVNEIRNDNIGFYQGDYPEVTNVSDRYQTNPFEQINYAIVQQLTDNYPELSAFLFGNPDKQYVIGDGPSNIGGGKAGRPRIHKGERAMTLNTASRRNQVQTTGDAALMAENRINPRTGNSIAYDKQRRIKKKPTNNTSNELSINPGESFEDFKARAVRWGIGKDAEAATIPTKPTKPIKLGGRGRPSKEAMELIFSNFDKKALQVPPKGSLHGNDLRQFQNNLNHWNLYLDNRTNLYQQLIKAGNQEAPALMHLLRQRMQGINKKLKENGYI